MSQRGIAQIQAGFIKNLSHNRLINLNHLTKQLEKLFSLQLIANICYISNYWLVPLLIVDFEENLNLRVYRQHF